jgi:hypothetical protein
MNRTRTMKRFAFKDLHQNQSVNKPGLPWSRQNHLEETSQLRTIRTENVAINRTHRKGDTVRCTMI